MQSLGVWACLGEEWHDGANRRPYLRHASGYPSVSIHTYIPTNHLCRVVCLIRSQASTSQVRKYLDIHVPGVFTLEGFPLPCGVVMDLVFLFCLRAARRSMSALWSGELLSAT